MNHIYVEDWTHYRESGGKGLPHYEVYVDRTALEKGRRDRAVAWDGRLHQYFV